MTPEELAQATALTIEDCQRLDWLAQTVYKWSAAEVAELLQTLAPLPLAPRDLLWLAEAYLAAGGPKELRHDSRGMELWMIARWIGR